MTEERATPLPPPEPPAGPGTGGPGLPPAPVPQAGTAGQQHSGQAPGGGSPAGDPQDQSGGAARQAAEQGREEGRQLADSARQEASSVAGSARQQTTVVAEEARQQARDLVGDTTEQLRQQADQQTHQLAGTLLQVADQVRALADGRPEEAGATTDYARQAAQRVGEVADRIDTLGVDGVVQEVQRFARRRPVAFLAGAAVAGFFAGRFVRNAGGGDGQSTQAGGQLPARTAETRSVDTEQPTIGASVGPGMADPAAAGVTNMPPATPADVGRPTPGGPR